MCDCISRINKSLREESGDPNASLDLGFIISENFTTMSVRPSGLSAFFRKKKKDGSFAAKKTTTPLYPVFCPFCGESYDDSSKVLSPWDAPDRSTYHEEASQLAHLRRDHSNLARCYLHLQGELLRRDGLVDSALSYLCSSTALPPWSSSRPGLIKAAIDRLCKARYNNSTFGLPGGDNEIPQEDF